LIAGLALAGTIEGGYAQTYQIQSTTMGDLYGHLRADGSDIVRRRVHQVLGVNAFDLLGNGENNLYFVSSFRYSTDFGIEQRDLDNNAALQTHNLALLYAYLEARDLGGFATLRFGRQMEVDAIDMLLFDGLRARFDTPWYFGAELLGGIEARNQLGPITRNPAELDGTLEKSIEFDGGIRDVTPRYVVGAGLYLTDLPYTQLDLKFRRIQMAGDGKDVNQQRAALSFSHRIIEGLFVSGSTSYDFFQELINEGRAAIRYRPIELFEIEASYTYLIPSFDADSIFNVFSWRPLNRANERIRFFFSDDLWVYAGSYQTFFLADDTVTNAPIDGLVEDIGATVGGRWTPSRKGSVSAEFSTQQGYGGAQTFVDVSGQYWFISDTVGADLRLLLALFDDEQRPNLDGTMFGVQAGSTWQFSDFGRLQVLVEHATTQLQPSWLRVFAVVSLDGLL
jgi:hypothetical protein